MINLIRIVFMAGVLSGSVWVALDYRSFGFAAYSSALTLILSLLLEMRRLKAEAPFFIGPRNRISSSLAFISATLSSCIRAVFVLVAALFLFSVNVDQTLFAVGQELHQGVLEKYISSARALDRSMLLAFFGTTAIFTVLGMLFNKLTENRGHRWALFRLVWMFSFVFTLVVTFTVKPIATDSTNRLFDTGEDAFSYRSLKDEFDLIVKVLSEAQKAPADKKVCDRIASDLIAEETHLSGVNATLRVKDPQWSGIWPFRKAQNAEWQEAEEKRKDSEREIVALKRRATKLDCQRTLHDKAVAVLMAVSVLEELASSKTVALANGVTSAENDNNVTPNLLSMLLGVIFSSTLVQGIVMATYVTLLLNIWNFGRRANFSTDAMHRELKATLAPELTDHRGGVGEMGSHNTPPLVRIWF